MQTMGDRVEVAIASSSARGHMNALIVACRDDARTFARAASQVIDPEGRKRLLEQSRRRRGFADALGDEVRSLGGTPAAHGSVHATLVASIASLRAAIAGPHEGDAYAACLHSALRTENAYARASRLALPERARSVVASQSREVRDSCRELAALRNRH